MLVLRSSRLPYRLSPGRIQYARHLPHRIGITGCLGVHFGDGLLFNLGSDDVARLEEVQVLLQIGE